MDATTNLVHEKMAKYFSPIDNYFLCEFIEDLKTEGGIILPEGADNRSIGHPVIAVGSKVEEIEVGDWIIPSTTQLSTFTAYGKRWFFARLYDIFGTVDMNYRKDEHEYKQSLIKPKTSIIN